MRLLRWVCESGHEAHAALYDEARCAGVHAADTFVSVVGLLVDSGALAAACACGSARFHLEDTPTPHSTVEAAIAARLRPQLVFLASSGATITSPYGGGR